MDPFFAKTARSHRRRSRVTHRRSLPRRRWCTHGWPAGGRPRRGREPPERNWREHASGTAGRRGVPRERFDCPPEHARSLARISEYVALTKGVGPLYDELHALFDHDYEPGVAHRLLAEIRCPPGNEQLPGRSSSPRTSMSRWSAPSRSLVSRSTWYSYLALGRHRGKFLHVGSDGHASVVEVPNA